MEMESRRSRGVARGGCKKSLQLSETNERSSWGIKGTTRGGIFDTTLRSVAGWRTHNVSTGRLTTDRISYPHINKFIEMLHTKKISSFMVTNAQFPDKIVIDSGCDNLSSIRMNCSQ